MQVSTGEGQHNLAPITIQLELPADQRPELQRQNGVVEDRSTRVAPPSGHGDVLPPAPFPQILGIRPATPAFIPPPAPALANSEPLIAPTPVLDLIPPPTSVSAMPLLNQPTSTVTSVSGMQFPASPSTSSGGDQGVISLPPFPSLRPDLAALMNPEGEMDQASVGSSRGG